MIEASGVSYIYPGESVPAVCDVTATVNPGEIVGIVGPNGSGKSTLSRMFKGLLLPEGGTLQVDGLDVRKQNVDVRRIVGMVFQSPDSQIVNAVVEQEVAFGPENMGLAPHDIRAQVDAGLAAVGLTGFETAECHTLSLANKQRVALAAVVAMEPRYLILDESTAWLEPASRRPLLQSVLDWCASREVGLVLVTHRMDEAQLCDRLYGMLDGRIEIVGPPTEVFGDAAVLERLALEIPDTSAIVHALRRAGASVGLNASIGSLVDAFVDDQSF